MRKIIAISGVSRCGKNTYANFVQRYFYPIETRQLSLAKKLKQDLRQEILDKYGLDSFSEKSEEKKIFRGDLVRETQAKRESGNGDYYTKAIEQEINELPIGVIPIITDLRYFDYEGKWIKDNGGIIIHIKKILISQDNKEMKFLSPANEEEVKNDSVCFHNADAHVYWPEGMNTSYLYNENFCYVLGSFCKIREYLYE